MGTASQSEANTQIKEKWSTKHKRKQTTFGCSSAGTWFLMWLRRNSASCLSFGKLTSVGALTPPELEQMEGGDNGSGFISSHGILQRTELDNSEAVGGRGMKQRP